MKNIELGNIFVFLFFQISVVRLLREFSNLERLKGFGYVEFEDLDFLFSVLSFNEEVKKIERRNLRGGSLISFVY